MEKWISNFLNKNKSLVGFADWKIFISKDNLPTGSFAQVEPNLLEKEMFIILPPIFFTFSKQKQKNILLHELIHSRFAVFTEETETFIRQREELMVNDLTRGMEKLL